MQVIRRCAQRVQFLLIQLQLNDRFDARGTYDRRNTDVNSVDSIFSPAA